MRHLLGEVSHSIGSRFAREPRVPFWQETHQLGGSQGASGALRCGRLDTVGRELGKRARASPRLRGRSCRRQIRALIRAFPANNASSRNAGERGSRIQLATRPVVDLACLSVNGSMHGLSVCLCRFGLKSKVGWSIMFGSVRLASVVSGGIC